MGGACSSARRSYTDNLMGYRGQQFRVPLIDTGFRDDRNVELLPPTALVYPSKNVNYHENGLSKRGGSSIQITGQGNAGQGIFQFRTSSQSILCFAANGEVFQSSYSNSIKSGLSTQNPICFIQTSNKVFFCDGQSTPQYWDGSSPSSSNVSAASSWSGNMPFQFVNHTRAGSGAGDRLWAVTPDSVWASKLNDPTDFGDANVVQIPIDSIGGLVGAYDLGGQLFAFSRTQTFLIQDTDSDIANWGYTNALWEGGVAHWRLIVKGYNNLFLMAEDGLIYSLQGVLTTGAYNAAALNRPAFVDKFIRDNVSLSNIANFNVAYDRKLRAMKWFMQEGGAGNNTALVYFIDKKPENAWILHDNENYDSGYEAAASCEVRVSAGNWQVWSIDYSGTIWGLEQSGDNDDGNPFVTRIKTKPEDLNIPRNNKHYMALAFRGRSAGSVDFDVNTWVEGDRQTDTTFSLMGTGATFGSAIFGTSTFATDTVTAEPATLGVYGRDLQLQLVNNAIGEDFFLSEIIFLAKPLGVKIYK